MKLVMARIGKHQTVKYAFEELVRYIKLIDAEVHIEGRNYDGFDESAENILWVGVDGSVVSSVDDEIRIDVRNGAGVITGSNERAVLIAVYRLLQEMGCRWIRPGKDGEVIVQRKLDKESLNVQVTEKASYRHRSVCIEGSNCHEHIYNIIDWLPKVGMNGYMMQHMVPHSFMRSHCKPEEHLQFEDEVTLSEEDVLHIWANLEEEITKRSLMYHAVGHGWNCEPFGIPVTSKKVEAEKLSPEVIQYLAQVEGKRELWKGAPLWTNLCYSNPQVREKMTASVVKYCRENPEVKYLHFWLGDLANNQCECTECQKMRPADYYVLMLNELDQKLTEAGIDTKVIFCVYCDIFWAPEYHRIENPERFVLMFAPIDRTYSQSYADCDVRQKTEAAPYVRNKLIPPKSLAENLYYLNSWQEQFTGDSFIFEYHLMWDHVFDPGYYECAETLHKDMAALKKIGLNGMVSCQVQRNAFPINLPMYAMTKVLWDHTCDFEVITKEYFETAFGEAGEAVKEYFKVLTALFHPHYMRGESQRKDDPVVATYKKVDPISDELAADFEQIDKVIDQFAANCPDEKLSKEMNDCQAASWRYLAYHAEYCRRLAKLLQYRAKGEKEQEADSLQSILKYLQEIQKDTLSVMDAQNYWHVLKNYL